MCHDLSTSQHVTLSDVGFCLKVSAPYITDSVALELRPNFVQRKFISHMCIHAKSIRQHTAHRVFKLKSRTKHTKDVETWFQRP